MTTEFSETSDAPCFKADANETCAFPSAADGSVDTKAQIPYFCVISSTRSKDLSSQTNLKFQGC